ncbi:MAG: hypothetical protein RSE91_02705, partial [Bacilli bacterium]
KFMTNKEELYNSLPIIDTTKGYLFRLNQSKEKQRINDLVNKHIVFELWDKENHTIQVLPGKLLEYNNDYLLIRQYDDGTEETRNEWVDGQGNDLFKDFEEKININNIRGIEEYKNLKEKDCIKYKGCICEIEEDSEKKITVLVIDYIGCELVFYYKHVINDKVVINQGSIIGQLIKNIRIIKKSNCN